MGKVDNATKTAWKLPKLVVGVLLTLGLLIWARKDPQGWQAASSAVAEKVVEVIPAVLDAAGRLLVAILNAITSALPPPSSGSAG